MTDFTDSMSDYRPEFAAALEIFAAVSEHMDAQGIRPPILVGGAAAELYSGSTLATGDFDVIARQDAFEAALRAHGFVRPSGPGMLTRGWVHPDLQLGFEVVGSTLLDGLADLDRVRLFDAANGAQFLTIAPEDLIADRLGQYASGTAPEMLEQARILFGLSKDLDLHYMERRIREETGNELGVSDLQV